MIDVRVRHFVVQLNKKFTIKIICADGVMHSDIKGPLAASTLHECPRLFLK